MAEEETVDIEQELEDLLTNIQPNLQDIIKRSFTNVAVQQTKNGETPKPDTLKDTSYFAKNTQVNLSRLELVQSPSFHVQKLSLDVKSMSLDVRVSLGEVNVKGIYSAYNENLYNLIPVLSEGHVLITISNLVADVSVGLVLEDDGLNLMNPGVHFTHDDVLVKLSWPSPQRNGGYDFTATEQLAKHIDDLPLTASISLSLFCLLQGKLLDHLRRALRRSTTVSEMMCCNPSLLEAFTSRLDSLASNGNRVIDMVLINMRRTILQSLAEVIELPPLHATFLHKIGTVSYVSKMETETGWLKNLATINRINDVTMSRPDPMKTSFRVTLRIKDLQLGYDTYRIKTAGTCCGGRLTCAFTDNSVNLAFSVGLTRWEPYAQLDDLTVQCMDGMDIHITGLGPLSSLTPLVCAWCRSSQAVLSLTRTLEAHAHTALAELPLWDMLHQGNKDVS